MKNKQKNSNVAVISAGAIGGVTAALMKNAGWDPILVCRHQEIVDRATTGGLHITGLKGDRRVAVKAVRTTDELPEDIDIFFLATKANDCIAAAKTLLPRFKSNACTNSLGVIAINATPRKRANTQTMVEAILAGSAHECAQTRLVNLRELELNLPRGLPGGGFDLGLTG